MADRHRSQDQREYQLRLDTEIEYQNKRELTPGFQSIQTSISAPKRGDTLGNCLPLRIQTRSGL